MMLIILVALIANSALLSDANDVAPPMLKDFDWNQGTGNWYFLMHNSSDFYDNLDCPLMNVASPECNISLLTNVAYDLGALNYVEYQGFARNWDNAGNVEVIHQLPFWTGNYHVLAVDYDRYFIAEHNLAFVYVAFRSSFPDVGTWLLVVHKLLEIQIDITQLVAFSTNYCQ